jgi:hypothetical protein
VHAPRECNRERNRHYDNAGAKAPALHLLHAVAQPLLLPPARSRAAPTWRRSMHHPSKSVLQVPAIGVLGFLFVACSAGDGSEGAASFESPQAPAAAGADEQSIASTDFVAGKRIHAEQLSPSSRLEFWDQGAQGVMVTISGHSDYDADKRELLKAAIDAEGPDSVARVYLRLRPGAEVPTALLQADLRLAGSAADGTSTTEKQTIEPAIANDADNLGTVVEVAEPDLPAADDANYTGVAIWFRDKFCSYPNHDESICLLDRLPDPYIQQTAGGYNHIGTVATSRKDVRYRTYFEDCVIFSCSWEKTNDVRVAVDTWRQFSWLDNDSYRRRRFRVDAWDTTNPTGPLVQMGITWRSSLSSTNTCKSTGQSCTSDGQCCIVDSSTRCYAGTCRNDPTPGTNCDWFDEACCFNGSYYCNRTSVTNLTCIAGKCN